MNKLLLRLEEELPYWLWTPKTQYMLWGYGILQIVRSSALLLFVLALPVYLWQIYYKKKRVLVVGESGEYYMMPLEDMWNHQWIRRTLSVKKYEHNAKMCCFRYGKHYYCAHADSLLELADCEEFFGENVVFVEKLLPITDGISVAKMISKTEAYMKVLSSQGYHISKSPLCVVPSWLDYVDVSTMFWGVLSTIPVLLQVKSYNRVSALLSFVIILVDLNRHPLYRVYDGVFYRFVKFVKTHIFKEREKLCYMFSFFSRRWKDDYMPKTNFPIRIRRYCKYGEIEWHKLLQEQEQLEKLRQQAAALKLEKFRQQEQHRKLQQPPRRRLPWRRKVTGHGEQELREELLQLREQLLQQEQELQQLQMERHDLQRPQPLLRRRRPPQE